jgi:hypothetical protein
LAKIESELDALYNNLPGGLEKEDDRVLIVEKEQRKSILLRQEEVTWRQKSRIN